MLLVEKGIARLGSIYIKHGHTAGLPDEVIVKYRQGQVPVRDEFVKDAVCFCG